MVPVVIKGLNNVNLKEFIYMIVFLFEQVIVVVTSDWTVLCFDHNLSLLWETRLMTVQSSRYFIRYVFDLAFHQLAEKMSFL